MALMPGTPMYEALQALRLARSDYEWAMASVIDKDSSPEARRAAIEDAEEAFKSAKEAFSKLTDVQADVELIKIAKETIDKAAARVSELQAG